MKKKLNSGIVTGCSKGIGLELIRYLIRRDYNLYAFSRKISNKLFSLSKKKKPFTY